jgi:hypothetical protein
VAGLTFLSQSLGESFKMFFLSYFKSDPDPVLTKFKKLMANNPNPWELLNELEKTVLILRTANKTTPDIAEMLCTSVAEIQRLELCIIKKHKL